MLADVALVRQPDDFDAAVSAGFDGRAANR